MDYALSVFWLGKHNNTNPQNPTLRELEPDSKLLKMFVLELVV